MKNKKHRHHFIVRLVYAGALSLFTASLSLPAFAQTQQWNFQESEDYTYDAKLVEVHGGQAQLIKRPPYRDEGQDAFDRGRFLENTWAARNNVELAPMQSKESAGTMRPSPVYNKTPGLVALWHFDEPSGTNLIDGVSRNIAKASDAEVVSGQSGFGYARLLDGLKGHVFIPHYESLHFDGEFSVEAWVRPVSTVNAKPQTLVSRWQTVAGHKGFALQIAEDGRLDFQVSADGETTVHHRGSTVLTPGFWYHITAVYNGSDLRIYLNGLLDSQPTAFQGPIFHAQNPIYIGALVNNRLDEFFEGAIDEVALYDRALTEVEALTHVGNANGLVALWNLNERGGVLADRSGYGHNAVAVGEPTYEVEGKFSNAVHFNGKKQFLESHETFFLSPESSLSLEAWIKPDRLPGNRDFATIISSTKGQTEFSLSIADDGRLRASAPALSPAEVFSHTTVMPNVWQHVAVTWGNGSVRLYLNGLLDGVRHYDGFFKPSKVGMRIGMDSHDHSPFKGAIDEVAVYRRSRTPIEISHAAGLYPERGVYQSSIKDAGGISPWQKLAWDAPLAYRQPISADAKGLLHLFHFDTDQPGAQVFDDDRGDFALNAVGTTDVPGVFGNARWFAAQSQDRIVSQQPLPKLSTFTLSYWIQFASHEPGLSDQLITMGDNIFKVYRAAKTGGINVEMEGVRKLQGATAVKDTRWHHVALTSDGSQLFLFLDGVLDGTTSILDGTPLEPITIGNVVATDTFEGAIDEFAVFNYALEREEIIDLFLQAKLDLRFLVRGANDEASLENSAWYGPKGRNLIEREPGVDTIGLWHFNQKDFYGNQFQISDASRFNNHGIVFGNVLPSSDGIIGGSFFFNGVSDYVEMPDEQHYHLQDELTLSAWIRPAEILANGARIIEKNYQHGAPVFSSFSLELSPLNRLALRIGRPGGYHIMATQKNGEIPVGRWTHVAGTYDGKEIKLYINGELKRTSPFREKIPYDHGSIFIGRYGHGQGGYFHGHIDEVAIDGRALSDDEITALFAKGDPENFYRVSDLAEINIPGSKLFQYQAHLATDYPYVTPILEAVEIEGSAYATDQPQVVNNISVSFADISGFRERRGAGNQGGITYQLSNDGRNWFYHNGRRWVIAAGASESNTAVQIEERIRDFSKETSIGSFYFRAFLNSPSGLENVQLEAVEIDYLPNKITVTTPNGAEGWLVGTEQEIKWNSAGEVEKVRIEYSRDGFKKDFVTIAKDYPNQGNYRWEVPDQPGVQYKVRVSDALDPRIYDTSDLSFRLTGAFEVVVPNHGERWKAGNQETISWRTLGDVREVKIEYSTDGFQQKIYPVIDSVKNTGEYVWSVPDNISPQVRIRVSDANDPTVADTSNDDFTIHGDLQMLEPKAGKRWLVGSEQQISWRTSGTIPTVNLEFAVKEPGEELEWKSIENIYSNRGSYVWTVPDVIHEEILIRVSDPNDERISSVSDPVATMGGLRLLTPKGEEIWSVASRRKISWQSIGTIPNVQIEYASLDNVSKRKLKKGISAVASDLEWQVAGESVPNLGSFIWEIPDIVGDNVALRIRDTRDSSVSATTQVPFQIIPGFVLIAPNGSEAWKVGTEQEIRWETKGTIDHVKLEYSTDHFTSDVREIIGKASNLGSYMWTVPDDIHSEVWIRVSDPGNMHAQDTSDAPYRIHGDFEILAPSGSQRLEAGTIADIRWNTIGSIPKVRLEYSKDDFVKDIRVIADDLENKNFYSWEVSDDIGIDYSLRVSDAEDPQTFSILDGSFSIVGNFYITNPVPGENYVVGTMLDIRWKGSSSVSEIRIDYSEDDFEKSFTTITDKAPNTGSFLWEIPNRIGQHFKLRIWNPANPESMSIMEQPSRVIGGFTLSSPNGGEVVYVGEPTTVSWKSYGTVPRVKLELSDDNFTNNVWEVTDQYVNLGRFLWNVPDLPSGQYKLRVSDPEDVSANDISNSDFRIRPRINILSPASGERWAVGQAQTIKWRSSGTVEKVNLEYTTDDFASVTTIAEAVPNTGSYEWIVPDRVSAHLKVRVTDVRDSGAFGVSSSESKIEGILKISSPNGGEVWRVGKSQPIVWSTEGRIEGVRLEYSRDGFQSEVVVIADSAVNSGSYDWTVPDDISPNVKVRVVDVTDAQVYGESDAPFKIAPSFMIMAPNGEETWHATEKREISWVTIGSVPEVDLHACVATTSDTSAENCFSTGYSIIEKGIDNQGRFTWDIPRIVGDYFKVRVCDSRDESICDSSDGVFSISSPFDVVYPRSPQSWLVGSDQEVRWQTYGSIESVLVQYAVFDQVQLEGWDTSKADWKTLETNLANKGQVLFRVPEVISSHVYFRISDWTDESLYAVSKDSVKFMGATSVVSPNGAEAWNAGTLQSILWNTVGPIENVRIEYSKDNFQQDIQIIEASYPNAGNYEWMVPGDLSPTAKIRVLDQNDSSVLDVSDNPFKIMPGFVLHAPNGGEIWTVGTEEEIRWSSIGKTSEVMLEYRDDRSAEGIPSGWEVIKRNVPNTGAYAWRIPDSVSHQLQVRVRAEADPEALTISNAPFEIKPDLVVTAPVDSQVLYVGKESEIRWASIGTVGDVTIQYSKDDFESDIRTITMQTSDAGIFNWMVPDDVTENAKIRVVSASDNSVYDDTDQPFKVLPKLQFLSPENAQQWVVDSEQLITWDWRGSLDAVKIEYSTNNFDSFKEIVAEHPNVGHFTWVVPDLVHQDVRFRISDAHHPETFTLSPYPVRVLPGFTLLSPNGGESWLMNTVQPITWVTNGTSQRILLQYQAIDHLGEEEVVWKSITGATRNDERYEWRVPEDVSSQVRVRILDVKDNNAFDESDNSFKILGGFEITAGKANENLKVGSVFPITWKTMGDIPAVKIEYARTEEGVYPTESTSFNLIADFHDNTNQYQWQVPDDLGRSVWFKISDAHEAETFALSKEAVTIVGVLNLTSPKGWEKWHATDDQMITWETQGSIEQVDLFYCQVDQFGQLYQGGCEGKNTSVIVQRVENAGSYLWRLPRSLGEHYKVQVCDSHNAEVCASSEQVFSIQSPFSFTTPSETHTWVVGEEKPFNWVTQGHIDRVSLFYSTLNGSPTVGKTPWKLLEKDYRNSGSYTLRVPDDIAKTVFFKVADTENSELVAVSAAPIKFAGQVTVLSPAGGEAFSAGSQQQITWDTIGTIEQIRLEYSQDDFVRDIHVIEEALLNRGQYLWQVPERLSHYHKVRVLDASDYEVSDMSGAPFKVMAGFKLTSPQSEDVLLIGNPTKIQWETFGNIQGVQLEYRTSALDDTSLGWRVIEKDYPDRGEYVWRVPNDASKRAQLRISDALDPDTRVVSKGYFVIRPQLEVLAPGRSNEVLQVGTSYDVKWQSVGNLEHVRLEYSKDNFERDIHVISKRIPDRGGFVWQVPNDVTTNARIRVVNPEDPHVFAVSAGTFQIMPKLQVLDPATEGVWRVGSQKTITWDWDGSLDEVKIEYSVNNFDSSKEIISGLSNVGHFTWEVPDHVHQDVKIRVSDAAHPNAASITEQSFRILPDFTVLSPNGGEHWQIGSRQTVKWATKGTSPRVVLLYQPVGHQDTSEPIWKPIGGAIRNDGVFEWQVPDDVSSKVRLRVADATDPKAYDESDAPFKIVGGFNLSSVRNTESLTVGTPYFLRWETIGRVPIVKIEYIKTIDATPPLPGDDFKLIQEFWDNTGNYEWRVPDDLGDFVWFRISDAFEPDTYQVTARPIRIVGDLNLLGPNGGEVLHATERRQIHWVTTGSIQAVDLSYCSVKDLDLPSQVGCSGAETTSIAQFLQNSESYLWKIPAITGERFKIQVCDSAHPEICDSSETVFSVLTPFEVLEPKTYETWTVGSEQNIRWHTYGEVPRVSLDYVAFDDLPRGDWTQHLAKANWQPLVSNLNNKDVFVLKVPSEIKKYVFYRVSDWANSPLFAVSTSPVKFAGALSITSPNGGEALTAGSEKLIQWDTIGPIENVNIEYSHDDFARHVVEIASNFSNTGAFPWVVPDDLSQNVKVRVTDSQDNEITDVSDNAFKVMAGFEFVYPQPEMVLLVGSQQKVQWQTRGLVDSVRLEYRPTDYVGEGDGWKLIEDNFPNRGEYGWTVPDDVHKDVMMRIRDVRDEQTLTLSAGSFEIRPWLELKSPRVGGEVFKVGTTAEIAWESTGSIQNVRLEYSQDDFVQDIRVISDSVPNRGSYLWSIPNDISENVRLRITSVDDANVSVGSQQPFKILPSLSMSAPMGSEKWVVGSDQKISWVWNGDLDVVSLEYSYDHFDSSTVIAESLPNTGAFMWQVPDLAGKKIRIRVTDPHHSEAFAVSEQVTSVIPGFKMIYPNGGELFKIGDVEKLEWKTFGTSDQVIIEYAAEARPDQADGDVVEWKSIEFTGLNKGFWNWTVPDDVSSSVQLRIRDAFEEAAVDVTDAPFKILARFENISPKPEEALKAQSTHELRWNTIGNVPTVDLAVSYETSEGVTDTQWIARGLENNGSYHWTVPSEMTERAWIRVADASERDAFAVSPAPFKIRGNLQFKFPEGRKLWPVGTVQTISWDAIGNIPTVDIEYSIPGKTEWKVVATDVPNSGSYGWMVPNDVGQNVRLRIRATNNALISSTVENVSAISARFDMMSPVHGEALVVGSQKKIIWHTIGDVDKVWVEFTTGNDWITVAGPMPNTGTLTWTIPDRIASHVRLRVRDADNHDAYAISHPFSIEGSLKALSPRGGDVFTVGQTRELLWETIGTIPEVRVEYLIENIQNPDTNEPKSFVIEERIVNRGNYQWKVADEISNHIKIRVVDIRNPSVSAETPESFSIIGAFNLLNPKGDESLSVGSTREIAWTTTGTVESVMLEYSRDNFAQDINVIGSDLPNTGLALWTIPDAISENVKVRLSDFKDPRAFVVQDRASQISGALGITMPGPGETWTVGERKALSWLTTGSIPKVRIEYSRDNFVNDIQVVENSVDNTGQYHWTVPDAISNTLRVRISQGDDKSVHAVSDAVKVQGKFNLTAPDKDSMFVVHGRYPIVWETVGSIPTVRLEYSHDNFGQDIKVIADDLENNGVYEWTIPDDIGSGMKIRVLDARDYSVEDISRGYIEIHGAFQFLSQLSGKRWAVNSAQPILWNTIGSIPLVRLDYSTDGFVRDIHLIADAVENKGKFAWTVPDDISDSVSIRITDASNARVDAVTDEVVSIVGSLSIVKPSAREVVHVGQAVGIQWDTLGTISDVRLEYSTSDSEKVSDEWKLIAALVPNTGSYVWEIPDDLSEFVTLRVSDASDALVHSVLPVPISIRGQLQMLSPQVGERWIVGTEHEIQWTATGSIPLVHLVYSRDRFNSDIQTVAENIANTGTFRWTVPNIITDQLEFRVQDANNNKVSATTAAPISVIGDFVWMKPVDNHVWKVGNEETIEWHTIGDIPEVRLEYYLPADSAQDSQFRIIYDRLPNKGLYKWRIPDQISEGMKIKVVDVRDSMVSAISPGNIKIEGGLAFRFPQANEVWQVGDVKKLTWNTVGTVPFVAVEYSWDNFQQSIVSVENNYTNENHYYWEIPDAISDDLRVRVRNVTDDNVYAVSEPIKIHGSLALMQPSGSQIMTVGEVRKIDWTSTGSIPSVSLSYSTDEFQEDIQTIEPVLDNTGSYHWNVPDQIAERVWLRVSDARDANVYSNLATPVQIQGSLMLTNPAAREVLTVGETKVLRWDSKGTIPTVRLEYSADEFRRNIFTIAKDVPNAGQFEWVVPDYIHDDVIVRVLDDRDPTVLGQTVAPVKIQGKLEMLSLSENAVWKVGEEKSLEWRTVGSIPRIRLEYSNDEFRNDVHVIYEAAPNQGALKWTVPDQISSGVRLRISDASNPVVSAYSRGTVKIEGDFAWLKPLGRETIKVGDEITLQWKTLGTVSKVALEYSVDGFQKVVRSIEKLAVNENQYEWRVPDHIGENVQLRVRDAADPNVYATSQSFDIQGDINILSPRLGSVWEVGSEQAIQWQSIGTIPQVRLEYSRDQFHEDVNLIVRAANATGGDIETYLWKVPDAISDRVWVRVTDVRNDNVSDISPEPFVIKGNLQVLEPKGAQVWLVGTEQQITWQTTGSIPLVRLEYSRDAFDRDKHSIAENVPNQGFFSWAIPDVVNEQIWIRVLDANNASVASMAPSTIRVQGSLALQYPHGGETWTVGKEELIKWSTTGGISQVRLEYIMQNQPADAVAGQELPGTSYIIIQDRVPSRGQYPWIVPDHLPPFIKIRIVDVQNPDVFSESEVPIKVQGTLQFLSPVQTERWVVGSTQELVWESRGFMPQVKLEYSRDGFKTESGMIYDLVPNAGSVKWVVPNVITDDLKLRISDPDNRKVFDVTEQPIEVVGDFRFLYPRGGEQWVVGSEEEIQWETIGSVANVRIEYSRDKFQRHQQVIAEAAPNIGRYVWTVADDIASDVWVRISDANDKSVAVIAEYPVSISGNLYLKKPMGGEIWSVGEKAMIKWDTIGSIPKVRLEYSTDDFFNSVQMTGDIDNEGSLEWLVPDIISDRMKIRVIDVSNSNVHSTSRMPLKIQGGFEFINPKGSEFWLVGSQHVVTWETFGTIPYVNLEYSTDNFSTVTPIILGTANTGSYTWMVPDMTAEHIRFRVVNAADQSVYAVNPDPIQIGGALTLLTPSGGEIWQVGETQEIRWRVTGTIPRVRIEYSSDQFRQDIQTIESSAVNKGFLPWKIPNRVGSGFQVRVADIRNPRIASVSRGPFKIIGGIKMLYPQGGEVWRVGSREKIMWETIGDIPQIRLEYSTDNFVSTMPITAKFMNTGSYDWEVPDLSGRRVKVRVLDAGDPSVYVETPYAVEVQGDIELVSPRGAEVWHVGSQQPIVWRTVGTIPNVTIEYSNDNFRSVETIASGIANGGNFLWSVPSMDTRNLKVRILDSSNPEIHDIVNEGIRVHGNLGIESPRGGEIWIVGSRQPITWESSGEIQHVRLEYSINNFQTTFPIVASLPNQGEYIWEVADAISTNLKIRISDVKNPSVFHQLPNPVEVRGALALTNPTGRETWNVGVRHPISWQTSGSITQVRIEYSVDDFVNDIQVIVPSLSNKGVYYWDVPAIVGNEAKIRITDTSNPDVYDVSRDNFRVSGDISLLFPNSGEVFQVGERIEIHWKATPNISNVKLEYSEDNFQNVEVISRAVPNSGSFFWNVPDEISDTLRIRVSDAQDSSVFSMSNLPFSIRGGLALISPRGGEVWQVGDQQKISWQTYGTMGQVRLEYSTDDFVTAMPIGSKLPNTGVFLWTVPEVYQGDLKVRVSDESNPNVQSSSTHPIKVMGSLNLITPNGGERWVTGEERVIKWDTNGHIPSVTVEYSTDDFVQDVQTIASAIPNVGSHYWRVPNDRSGSVKVRIRSGQDMVVFDQSELPFQIDYYKIHFVLRDASTRQHLANLTFTDSAGTTRSGVGSPLTLEYPYGIYTTVWSKPGFEEKRSTWLADQDRNFQVNLMPTKHVVEQPRVNFQYDKVRDLMKVSSWFERAGKAVPAVIRTEVRVYDGSKLIKTLASSNPDSQGYFNMVWDTKNLAGNKRYLASASITTSTGQNVTSPISYQLDIPVKEKMSEQPKRKRLMAKIIDTINPVKKSTAKSAVFSNPVPEAQKDIKPALEGLAAQPSRSPIRERVREAAQMTTTQPNVYATSGSMKARLVAPDEAVLNETISITYFSQSDAYPVVDVYDANRKLIVKAQPMQLGAKSGQFTYLLPIKGIGFVPGRSIKVVVIERKTANYQSSMIAIRSAQNAMGLDRQIGSTSILKIVRELDRLVDEIEEATKKRQNVTQTLEAFDDALSELAIVLTDVSLEPVIVKTLNRVGNDLAKVIENKGYDAAFLTKAPLSTNSSISDVGMKIKDFRSAVFTLNRLYQTSYQNSKRN